MKKEIIIKIEYESDEQDYTDTDEFIKQDLETEINCCCNSYNIKSIDITEVCHKPHTPLNNAYHVGYYSET